MVAAGAARRFELQVAYAIGVAEPVAVYVDTFGTGVLPDQDLARVVRELFDLRPLAIIDRLQLRDPVFRFTSAYGHFGRRPRAVTATGINSTGSKNVELFTWERLDRVEEIRDRLGV
jgi:S-adenosylmethionine synthetase